VTSVRAWIVPLVAVALGFLAVRALNRPETEPPAVQEIPRAAQPSRPSQAAAGTVLSSARPEAASPAPARPVAHPAQDRGRVAALVPVPETVSPLEERASRGDEDASALLRNVSAGAAKAAMACNQKVGRPADASVVQVSAKLRVQGSSAQATGWALLVVDGAPPPAAFETCLSETLAAIPSFPTGLPGSLDSGFAMKLGIGGPDRAAAEPEPERAHP
jgi:hypothetical protein